MSCIRQIIWLCLTIPLGTVVAASAPLSGTLSGTNAEPIGLAQCLVRALANNRALQIERLNPAIAQGNLASSYGYYDPLLTSDLRRESSSDAGGFDPADFSRDAVYEADSLVNRSAIIGTLPWGMSYSASGSYAHSEGSRNLLNFESYNLTGNVEARQPLLRDAWIDQGRLLIRVSKRNIEISELGVAFLTMDVINRVQQAYYELAYGRELVQVRNQLLAARQATLAGLDRQITQGMLAPSDKLLAESQESLASTSLVEAEMLQAQAENELRFLMGDNFSNVEHVRWVPSDRLILLPRRESLMDSFQYGLNHRPDLQQLRVETEKADLGLRYRRNQLLPSLDVVAGYGRRGANTSQVVPPASPQASSAEAWHQFRSGTAPSDVLGVIFSVPLSLQTERGNFRASKGLKAQAELRVKQMEEQVLREITDAYQSLQLSQERVSRSRQSVRLAEEAVEVEKKKLAGGNSSLFVVLQLQNDVANSKAAEVRARADFNQALSRLQFSEGSLLENSQVRILTSAPDRANSP